MLDDRAAGRYYATVLVLLTMMDGCVPLDATTSRVRL
jgi:hypothetical protein